MSAPEMIRTRRRPAALSAAIPVIRERTRGPAMEPPASWPNGSAVYQPGTATGPKVWGTPDEANTGLLGRVLKAPEAGTWHVWRWSAPRQSYAFLGAAKDFVAALGMMG